MTWRKVVQEGIALTAVATVVSWQETWIQAFRPVHTHEHMLSGQQTDTCSPFEKSKGEEGPRKEKEGHREHFPASQCHLTVPPSGEEGREVGKRVFRCTWFLLSHTASLSLTGFLWNSRECSLRHLSHKASACPRIGTRPRVASSSGILTSRVWTGDHIHSIFAMPRGGEVGFTPGPTGMAWHLPTSQAACEFMADSHTPSQAPTHVWQAL